MFALTYLFLFPIARCRPGYFYAFLAQTYSYSHAIFTAFLNSSVGWIPSNAKHVGVSAAFRQVTLAVSLYVLTYLALIALAIRTGMFHLFDYNYYSVQFWMFYNLGLSGALLWQLYRAMENAQMGYVSSGTTAFASMKKWQLKTAGMYTLLVTGIFFAILYL